MRLKYLALTLLTLTSTNVFSGSFAFRVEEAMKKCVRPNQHFLQVEFKNAPADMVKHYRTNYAQAAMFPIYRGIVDEFGSVLQGVLDGGDEFAVRPSLNSIARQLKAKQAREGLSAPQAICLASCVTNALMEPDDEVFPTTSMDMAIADGKGFCRHYMLSTKYMLERMSIKTQTGLSWDHTFLYFTYGERKYIFDPTVSDGLGECSFFNTDNL